MKLNIIFISYLIGVSTKKILLEIVDSNKKGVVSLLSESFDMVLERHERKSVLLLNLDNLRVCSYFHFIFLIEFG
jgi:hypothetical protein